MNCRIADGVCIECAYGFFLGEDSRCSTTKYSASSDKGKCDTCLDNFYLGLDNKCINVENCIYSNQNNECIECEEKFYYDSNKKLCINA